MRVIEGKPGGRGGLGRAAARLRKMHDRLAEVYGPQHWWPAETALEVIVGAYLTQNTAWTAVERSIENLRRAGALSLEGLRAIRLDRLRRLIRPSGFYTRKAPAIKAFVDLLDSEFGGSLEAMAAAPTGELRQRLLELPGVGPETADAILLYGLGHAAPVADEYLRRIALRHGLLEPAPGAQPFPPRSSISYDALTELTRLAFAPRSAAEPCATFQRIPRADGGGGKGSLRPHGPVRRLPAGLRFAVRSDSFNFLVAEGVWWFPRSPFLAGARS